MLRSPVRHSGWRGSSFVLFSTLPRTARAVLLGASALCALGSTARALEPGALPGGGQVTAGQAAIAQSGNRMTITQTTPRAAIAWRDYSIGAAAGVTYVQPNAQAIALNRVIGN